MHVKPWDVITHQCPNLTHWGRVTHICVGNLTIIGLDNGLSPGRRQAIIWTNTGILLIGPRGRNFSEILFGIHTFTFKKIHLKMSSARWRPFCLGLNVLNGGLVEFITWISYYIPQKTISMIAYPCIYLYQTMLVKMNPDNNMWFPLRNDCRFQRWDADVWQLYQAMVSNRTLCSWHFVGLRSF